MARYRRRCGGARTAHRADPTVRRLALTRPTCSWVFDVTPDTYRRRMSTPAATSTRRPADPARRQLGFAVAFVAIGSFLPWIYTSMQPILGGGGPGLWTFCAAMIALGGLILRFRRLTGAQAVLLAVAAIALPVWQFVHLVRLVGFAGWYPGPGLVVVFAGGVMAALAAHKLLTTEAPSP